MKSLFAIAVFVLSVNSYAASSALYKCANKKTRTALTLVTKDDRVAQVTISSPIKKNLDCTLAGRFFRDDAHGIAFAHFVCWDKASDEDDYLGDVILSVNSLQMGGYYWREFEDSALECFISKP